MSFIDDFNKGMMRAGTAFEHPMASIGERAGYDAARGQGGGGGGGGLAIVAIFALAVIAVIALPTLSLAFFATPVFIALLRVRGASLGYRAAFVVAAQAIFLFILLFYTLLFIHNLLAPFMGDSSPMLALIHTAQMVSASWNGTQSNIIMPEFEEWASSLAMQSLALLALFGIPLIGMAIVLRRATGLAMFAGAGGMLWSMMVGAATMIGGAALMWLTLALLGALGTPLEARAERFWLYGSAFTGLVAVGGAALFGIAGLLLSGLRARAAFMLGLWGVGVWCALSVLIFYFFRGADPAVAAFIGLREDGSFALGLIFYGLLQLPALVFGARIAGDGESVAFQSVLAILLALVGNVVAMLILGYWAS